MKWTKVLCGLVAVACGAGVGWFAVPSAARSVESDRQKADAAIPEVRSHVAADGGRKAVRVVLEKRRAELEALIAAGKPSDKTPYDCAPEEVKVDEGNGFSRLNRLDSTQYGFTIDSFYWAPEEREAALRKYLDRVQDLHDRDMVRRGEIFDNLPTDGLPDELLDDLAAYRETLARYDVLREAYIERRKLSDGKLTDEDVEADRQEHGELFGDVWPDVQKQRNKIRAALCEALAGELADGDEAAAKKLGPSLRSMISDHRADYYW